MYLDSRVYEKDVTRQRLEGYLESLKGFLEGSLREESAVNSIYIDKKKVRVEVDRKSRKSVYQKVDEMLKFFIPSGGADYYPYERVDVRGVRC
jgi:hypothetical protein